MPNLYHNHSNIGIIIEVLIFVTFDNK